MIEFEYNRNRPHKENFTEWYHMNCKERSDYGIAHLTIEVAKKRFKHYYGHLATWVWINID